jgi:hypothetical protein
MKLFRSSPWAKQRRQPLGVVDVRLPSGKLSDMARIDQCDVEASFEHGMNWHPVHAGALEGDVRHLVAFEPGAQLFESRTDRRKRSKLFLGFRSVAEQQASRDARLVHVETTTALYDDLHLFPPVRRPEDRHAFVAEILLHALPHGGVRQTCGSSKKRGSVFLTG